MDNNIIWSQKEKIKYTPPLIFNILFCLFLIVVEIWFWTMAIISIFEAISLGSRIVNVGIFYYFSQIIFILLMLFILWLAVNFLIRVFSYKPVKITIEGIDVGSAYKLFSQFIYHNPKPSFYNWQEVDSLKCGFTLESTMATLDGNTTLFIVIPKNGKRFTLQIFSNENQSFLRALADLNKINHIFNITEEELMSLPKFINRKIKVIR